MISYFQFSVWAIFFVVVVLLLFFCYIRWRLGGDCLNLCESKSRDGWSESMCDG